MVASVQSRLRQAFGSVKDHVSVGRAIMHSHDRKGFSDIEVAVVHATAHDNSSFIDDYHVHEILFLVSNTSGSIPFLAERISRRLAKTRDVLVAMKTLVLIHRLLRGGNRGFEQELRRAHTSGHLQMCSRWFLENPDPSYLFLKNYAFYMEERVGWLINQAGKLEPLMRNGLKYKSYEEKLVDMVFRRLPKCQEFMERVLRCSTFDTLPFHNLVQTAITNTLKESFQVYMTYCDGVAALVDMFFDLARPARAIAYDMLRTASRQGQDLRDFYEKCRHLIGNKSLEYPCVKPIIMDHVTALKQCSDESSDSSPSSKTQAQSPSAIDLLKMLDKSEASFKEGGDDNDDEKVSVTFSSTSPLTWSMETRISTVWVVFEDEECAYA